MILIVDDDKAVLASISLLLEQNGLQTVSATDPEDAWKALIRDAISLVILDMNFTIETTGEDGLIFLKKIKAEFPDIPVILITAWGHMSLAIDGMKAGAADFLNKPWENAHLLDSVNTALNLSEKKTGQKDKSRAQLNKKFRFEKITGNDPRLIDILQIVGRISNTNASVLITGESGTGKELIAEAIHENSSRKDHPFVKVNLGAIPSSLFESEMFGHKKGAFTDAHSDRTGRFEQAHKGTLFLDELGELDLNNQVKLLRVLQERKFEPLGSSETKTVDVRIITATNRNLASQVSDGKFREDLYYRINLITLHLPPLRERRDDIPLLVNNFLGNLAAIYSRPGLHITARAMNWLCGLPFNGNIRELKNLVERTVLLSDKETLDISQFKHQAGKSAGTRKSEFPEVGEMSLEEMEIGMITRAMAFHRNNISEAARSLGISRNALYRRLDKYGISYET
jgi:DNA-binding NtrC family response regulator